MFRNAVLIIAFLALGTFTLFGQVADDYQTIDNASGLWSNVNNWQRFNGSSWVSASSSPSSTANQISVRNGANLTIGSNVTLDQVVIETGAKVEITGGTTTLANGSGTDLIVYGHLKVTYIGISLNSGATVIIGDGGVYEHNRSLVTPIVTATWENGSTCLLTGTDSPNPAITSLNYACMQQDFYDLTLNYGVITQGNDYRTFAANQPIDVRNKLKLLSGNLYVGTDTNARSLNVNNLEISSGKFVATRGYAYPNINIRNDFTINGGEVIISEVTDAVDRDYSLYTKNLFLESGTLNLNAGSSASNSTGRVFVSGIFIMSGGVLTNTPAHASTNAGIYFNGTADQSFIWSGGNISMSSGGVGRLFFYKTTLGPTALNETYNGTSPQISINGLGGASLPSGFAAWPTSGTLLKELNIDNPAGVTLSTNKTVNTGLYLNNGSLSFGGNTLNLTDGLLIVRKSGNLVSAPAFGSLVTISYLYTPSLIITGYEVPASGSGIHNFVVNNSSGVQLNKNITLNGVLSVVGGFLDLNGYSVEITQQNLGVSGTNSLLSFQSELNNEPASHGEGMSSISRKWTLIGSSDGELEYTFSWHNSADNGGGFDSVASIWRFNGITWTPVAADVPVVTEDNVRSASVSMQLGAKADSEDEYTITGEGQTLPVVLSSFTAFAGAGGFPLLTWVTQSETNLLGYYIWRNAEPYISTSLCISNLIYGTNSATQQTYKFLDSELQEHGTYYYWLQIIDLDGSASVHGPTSYTYSSTDNDTPSIPLSTGINGLFPNPFNPSVNIRYGLVKDNWVSLKVYNQRGQVVKHEQLGYKPSGLYTFIWNGTADSGLTCGSGVYTFKLQIGSESFVKKATLMK